MDRFETIEAFVEWALGLEDPRFWELRDGRAVQRPASWVEDGLARTEVLGQLWPSFQEDEELELFGPGLLVPTGPRTAIEPHFVVVPRAGLDGDSVVVRDPLVVVEVPRRDARAEHWLPRLRGYALLPSVRHVLAVHPRARAALHLRREGQGAGPGAVAGRVLRGGVVRLDPLAAALDLDTLWARLDKARSRGSD